MSQIPTSCVIPLTLLLGSLIGSFLNVCIYRLPRGMSIVAPRSRCPRCQKGIPWYHNIPILSFLILRGKCHSCGHPISLQYPLVEALTALFSLLVYLKFREPLPYLFYFVFLTAPLIAMTFIDLEHRIIPDLLSLTGIVSGIVASLFLIQLPLIEILLHSLGGIIAGGGTLFLINLIYEKIRHHEGIGGGDVKLAAMIGAFFGWKGIFLILLLSSLFGSFIGLILMIFFHKGGKVAIPYGPFLAAGTLLYLFCGPQLLEWYLGLMQR